MKSFCLILCLAAVVGLAGPDPSPDFVFNDLQGAARRPLDSGRQAGSVVIFYWQDCPVSNSYAPELNRLCASYTNFAFYIVQVDSTLTRDAAKEHARKFDLHPPVLLDPRHRLVHFFKATVTPEAVVVGKQGELLYRGRIDDGYVALGKKRAAITAHDLQDALDAILAGKPVKKMETKAIGCLIQ